MFRFIILFVALVAGGGAAWIAFAMRGEPAVPVVAQQVVAPAPTRDVLIAAIDLSPGQSLTGESTRWQAWPESAVHPAHISRAMRPDARERLVGATIHGSVIAGEPIRQERLVPLNNGLLSSMLRSGKRAVAVRISAENTAGGFILPNDRVDVLSTVGTRDKPDGQKDFTSRTILTNVTVLAIDQTLEEKAKDEKNKPKPAAVGKTATLELDPRQVELLTAAEASGTISLALRSAADNAEIATAPPPSPVAAQPAAPTVFIVRGGSATTTTKPQ